MELNFDLQYLVNKTLLKAHEKELKEVNVYYKFREWIKSNIWYLNPFNKKNRMIFLYACENNVKHMLDWYMTQPISDKFKFNGLCLAVEPMPFDIESNSIPYTQTTSKSFLYAKDFNKMLNYLSVNDKYETTVFHLWEKLFIKMVKYDINNKIEHVYQRTSEYYKRFTAVDKLYWSIDSKCFFVLYKYARVVRERVLYHASDKLIIQLFNIFKGTEYFSQTEMSSIFRFGYTNRKMFIDALFMEDKRCLNVHGFIAPVSFNPNNLMSKFKKKIEL